MSGELLVVQDDGVILSSVDPEEMRNVHILLAISGRPPLVVAEVGMLDANGRRLAS